jgi:PDZ domain-containing protein
MRWFMRACGVMSATVVVSASMAQAPAAKKPTVIDATKPAENAATAEVLFTNVLAGTVVAEENPALLNWSRFLGVDFAFVDPPLRSQLKLDEGKGWVVVGVNPDTVTDSELQIYDVVVGLDGEPKQEGKYPVTVWRGGAQQKYTLKAKPTKQYWIGVNLGEIDGAMRSQLSLPEGRGLIVQEITDKAPAQEAGLQRFDVIVGKGDGSAPGTVEEFSKMIQKGKGETISLQILRHAKSMTVNVTPVERPKEQGVTDLSVNRYYTWVTAMQHANAANFHQQQYRAALINTQPATYEWTVAPRYALTFTGKPTEDRDAKLAAVEKHLDQLLKEVQAARQSLDEIRKLSAANKEKPKKENSDEEKK